MAKQSTSDRTSVTISKKVHQEFKVVCAQLVVTQKTVLERLIQDWLREVEDHKYTMWEKEE